MRGTGRLLALCSASVLLAAAGDPVAGQAVVTRQSSTCTLCHAGPFPNRHLQGTIGPELTGVGARLTEAEIRARLVDASAFNPATVMPSFGLVGGTRVGAAWQGKPILTSREIDDAAAYLAGLK
jgi:L-cysteine S-thiosulfotransferase